FVTAPVHSVSAKPQCVAKPSRGKFLGRPRYFFGFGAKGTLASFRTLSKADAGESVIRKPLVCLSPAKTCTEKHSKQITKSTVLPSWVTRMPWRGLKQAATTPLFSSTPFLKAATSFVRVSASFTVVLPRSSQP